MKYIKKYKLFENVVTELYLSGRNLTELPGLPDTLKELYCYNNNLTELPELPETLVCLDCGYNKLPYKDLNGYWKWYYNKYPERLAAKNITYEIV